LTTHAIFAQSYSGEHVEHDPFFGSSGTVNDAVAAALDVATVATAGAAATGAGFDEYPSFAAVASPACAEPAISKPAIAAEQTPNREM
jgi:hypothetical protein